MVPQDCAQRLLKLAHDDLGHNGLARTYMLLRRNYFWKGMKPQVYKYIKQCPKCQACNSQVVKYHKGHFNVPKAPMDFILMDFIGEFRPPTNKGYKYTLTVICMLTGFTWCIPIKSKNAEESPFFLMYGRDPRIPLTEMVMPRIRYLGTDECILLLEALTEIYHLVAREFENIQRKTGQKCKSIPT